MGMITTYMRRVPEGKTLMGFIEEVMMRLDRMRAEEEIEGYDILKGAWVSGNFDQLWEDQENLKKTPEIKEKYRQLASQGLVVVVEVDE